MKSEIKIITPKGAAVITLGLMSGIIIVAFMIMFPIEILWASRAAVGIGSLAALAKLCFWGLHQKLAYDIEKAKLDTIQLQSKFLVLSSGQTAINGKHEVVFTPRAKLAATVAEVPSAEAELTPVLDVINNEQQVCLFGPRGSGKTNLALHWLDSYGGEAIIIDVKGRAMNLWPDRFEVISDVKSIPGAIQHVLNEMKNHRTQGVKRSVRKLLFIDELKYLQSQHNIEAMTPIMDVAVFGREYGFDASFTTHGTTVKHLDIDAAALLDNFTVVKSTKLGNDHQSFIIGADNRETRYAPPNAYPKPEIKTKAIKAQAEQIAEMIKAGATDYAIANAVFSNRNDKIYGVIQSVRKALLDEPD